MKEKFKQWSLVGAGGGLGTLLRFGIAEVLTLSTFPIATLFVNLIGSLLLGGFTAYLYIRSHKIAHLIFGVGFCGSFTTMSMFAADVTTLLNNALYTTFLWYVSLSLIGGILLATFGYIIIKNLFEKRASS